MLQGLFFLSLLILFTAALNYFKYSSLQFNVKYNLSVSDTILLKGIAILMVVIGHIGTAIPGFRVFTPLGATGIGLFLICSGFISIVYFLLMTIIGTYVYKSVNSFVSRLF